MNKEKIEEELMELTALSMRIVREISAGSLNRVQIRRSIEELEAIVSDMLEEVKK